MDVQCLYQAGFAASARLYGRDAAKMSKLNCASDNLIARRLAMLVDLLAVYFEPVMMKRSNVTLAQCRLLFCRFHPSDCQIRNLHLGTNEQRTRILDWARWADLTSDGCTLIQSTSVKTQHQNFVTVERLSRQELKLAKGKHNHGIKLKTHKTQQAQ